MGTSKSNKYTVVSTWSTLPRSYQVYIALFGICSPLWILGFYWAGLDIIYGLVFMGVNIVMIFTTEEISSFPHHSTLDHFERADRLNWYNLVPGISLVFASLLFMWSPIHRGTTIFLLWGVGAGIVFFLSYRFRILLGNDLVVDYLATQLPHLPAEVLRSGCALISRNNTISVRKLSLLLRIDASDATTLRHLYRKYLERNLSQQ